MTIEQQLWGKPNGLIPVASPVDPEPLDQGKQTKHVHVPEGIGPPEFLVQRADVNDKGVMERMNGGDVPGITGEGTCAEATCVINEVGDNHFDDLLGKPGGRGRACRGGLWGSTT